MKKYIAVFEVEDDCNILTMDAEVNYTYETNGTNYQMREGIEFVRVEEPEPKTGWIPVSERLPEESKRYVVATKYNDVMTDFYTGEIFLQGDDIIAWMPLPEPFEPKESEDKE